MKLLEKLFGGSAGSIIDSIANTADRFITTKEDKMEFEKELQKIAQDAERMVLDDRNSARDMQKEALRQNDTFSKRYVYYLSAGILLAAIGFGAALLWIEIPESNRRMIEMFADIFLFSGAITVINFFFGSSRGSDEKTGILRRKAGED